jgi:hypothetical protein
MKLTDMKSDFILDSDTETDVIHFHYDDITDGMFYFKHRYLNHNFMGKKIGDPDDYIRTKSIWYVDFKSKTKIEAIPFGKFDINEARVIGNYLYFTKIIDINIWNSEEMDFKFIYNAEQKPVYVVLKRFIFDGDSSSEDNKLICFEWKELLDKLEWEEI